ncbi:hypothetical protein [Sunxiuqinia elliptica]|uniref:Uncharacterized protein n=1 Tax=Sunxiuqinia elliptica TaxID=655355 RepID=A0A1I2MB37_9BACT|nr:hypothetical protein [Sunxiuqinia elliptica]TDN96336.1 hypothetical protein DET52_112163 [Sunxiuqinia elliptica]TDO68047.1 hypothetical protein DET65_0163 [Sunxiuqinia elliptica]SFF88029.1 hypothetical protein SAMN05216283_11922 [Sunxiuqinia elliptica]
MRKLNTSEKFLISFIIVLLVAIAFNWKDFSKGVRDAFQQTPTEETAK